MPIAVVDLFCGAGGLTRGFVDEGFQVVAGFDTDPACRYPYERNNLGVRFYKQDVTGLRAHSLAEMYPPGSTRILAGCAPCQPFSPYSNGHLPTGDRKWTLLESFGRLVEGIIPEVVTMENTPQVQEHPICDWFVRLLRQLGYHVWAETVKCRHYGVPQSRERFVLLASLLGPIILEAPSHRAGSYVTVERTIGHLPPIAAGQAHPDDPLHRASRLSETNLRRIRASKPGGTWRDWPEELRAACHQKVSGKTYPSVYGRMVVNNLAPTITTQFHGFGNGRFGHPVQDRALSLREGALLQTFPADYLLVEPGAPVHFSTIARLIGNAVPVALARAVARSIRLHLEAQHDYN